MALTFLRRLIPTRVANNASQQRDHHANERTFLSWTRAGLGFAAMALALDRLEAIDRVLCSKFGLEHLNPVPAQGQLPARAAPGNQEHDGHDGHEPNAQIAAPMQKSAGALLHAFSAAKLCQMLGVWCLGYGFFRYWSMRRYLLVGQFVPAFWGPVFMTCGSFGAFMALGLQVDRKAFLVNL